MSTKVLDAARDFLKILRANRRFKLLVDIAEACGQNNLNDPQIVIWHAQGLIEIGNVAKARVLLATLAANSPVGSENFIEAKGLLGRAWKQSFFDSKDNSSSEARDAIRSSFFEYKSCFDASPGGSPWPGVNLLALTAFAKRSGIVVPNEPPSAEKVLTLLEGVRRDNWYHGSRAEAYLSVGDLDKVENEIGKYVRDEATTAFELGSTLRQFTELWQLDQQGERGHGIIEALRAALLQKEQGQLEMSPNQVRESVRGPGPSQDQLQAILGPGGQVTYDWLRDGMVAARSVGVISSSTQGRFATGFLVRRRDFFPDGPDDLVVITNAHVVSDPPSGLAAAFDDANITFEAVDGKPQHKFSKLLWQSPVEFLDCALLELKDQPVGMKPLELSKEIPPVPKTKGQKVFIIGYPYGNLKFSIDNNELLNLETPPDGTPPRPAVCRVQYRAPTEKGSSGSPVFESKRWRVIALHHAGSEAMDKLNGQSGTWPANEGMWLQSIVKVAMKEGVRP